LNTRLALACSGIVFLTVVLSGCDHKKPPVPIMKVGDTVTVIDGLWPICTSEDKIREFDEKIWKKHEYIPLALTDEIGSCGSTFAGDHVRILAIRGRFYEVNVPKGVTGWTTAELWKKKNPK